ncbi:hypothetical protein P692DRAFT_20865560 [Suillus brevipes Sb2]|nr:hypothetical protein P692DRAFT_20865560 [Suillus brevipes Sb2]
MCGNNPLSPIDPTERPHTFFPEQRSLRMYNLILNEPAGNIAKIILKHTVNLVTKAWDDSSLNVNQVTDEALQCLFHPDFHQSSSVIRRDMLDYMRFAPAPHVQNAQMQQGIQGLVQGIPSATQMQGLMNMMGGSAGTG